MHLECILDAINCFRTKIHHSSGATLHARILWNFSLIWQVRFFVLLFLFLGHSCRAIPCCRTNETFSSNAGHVPEGLYVTRLLCECKPDKLPYFKFLRARLPVFLLPFIINKVLLLTSAFQHQLLCGFTKTIHSFQTSAPRGSSLSSARASRQEG